MATDATFAGFQNWKLVAQEQGSDPALGAAHAGNDSTVTHDIYYKDDASRVPIGNGDRKRNLQSG